MFKFNYKKIFNNVIFTIFILTLIKLIFLYNFTIKEDIMKTFLYTLPIALFIYSLLYFMNTKYSKIIIFSIQALISVLLFIDLVYYGYYGFLPSVNMFLFVGAAGEVWKSILAILRPIYFLMFIDLIPLAIYLIKTDKKTISFKVNKKVIASFLIATLCLGSALYLLNFRGNSTYAYNNYGVFTYHIYDVYTNFLNKSEKNLTASELKESINTFSANDKEKNKKRYNGIAKDKNIIVVQFESLNDFLINKEYKDQEITPNINKLISKDSIYFNNFYQQVGPGNTSDAEFVLSTSLFPSDELSIFNHYNNNYYYTLQKILKENNYSTHVFHGNDKEFWSRDKMYPKLGIDEFISLEDFDYEKKDIINLGLNDVDFFNQTVNHMKEFNKPFYSTVINITSHHPYEIPKELKELKIDDQHKNTLFANYIESINYSDRAFGEFIQRLKEEGLYEESIIILYGDHSGVYPTGDKSEEYMKEFLGNDYEFDEYMNIPLIINLPQSGLEETNEIVGGEIDLMPTILNLLGIDNNKGKRFGSDLNNSNESFVSLLYHVPVGSFIDDEKVFRMSNDGIFENSIAWNKNTKKAIDIEECRAGYEKAIKRFEEGQIILENDLIDDIIREQKNK
ncbi:MAG: LTA synthase family protein [Senegalia sp. (in: firmicutes)]